MRAKLLSLLILVVILMTYHIKVKAISYREPYKIRCTCYTADEGSVTSSGQKVREGIVAGKKSWENYVVIMYECNSDGSKGDFIGFYEVLDTGAGIDTDGDGKGDSIKNGTSIDVYRDTLERAKEWVATYGDYVYIQLVPTVG